MRSILLLLALVAVGWGCMFGCQAEKAWQFNAPMSGEVDADLYATMKKARGA